jgi:methyl-accepting chemotaxis protein
LAPDLRYDQSKHDRRFSATNQENTMAESLKDKVADTGHKIAETATKVVHKVGEKVEEAADLVKEKAHQVGHRIEEAAQTVKHKVAKLADSKGAVGSTAEIREHMEVYGSCGNMLGKVPLRTSQGMAEIKI